MSQGGIRFEPLVVLAVAWFAICSGCQPAVTKGERTNSNTSDAIADSGIRRPLDQGELFILGALADQAMVDGELSSTADERPKARAGESTKQNQAKNPDEKAPLGMQALNDELNQKIAPDWPKPQVVLYVSGQQHGYIEPCGCTGLDSQKGGLIRRDTLLTLLKERGWEIVPMDVGNQIRRKGQQPLIKFTTTARALQQMGYQAIALGIDDVRLSKVELIGVAASTDGVTRPFICANATVLIPDMFPAYKIVEAGGRKIGITAFIGAEYKTELEKEEVEIADPVESLQKVVPELKAQGCDFVVLLAHASIKESADVAAATPDIDLVVTAGGFGEPTRDPEPVAGSKAVMVQVGTKGMYGGIIGLFDDPKSPIRYQRLAISSQFKDSKRMLELFAQYQDRLKEAGFDGLGLRAARHGSGHEYVGTEVCGDCHTTAYQIWKDSPHFHATDDIVAPNNDRGGIARHFDPECLSCHVTGWNPQEFSPYETGYVDLEKSEHLVGSGCENCHGPGSAHVAAENGDIEATPELIEKLRQELILPLDKAPQKCVECHDLDNSPAFHEEGAFEKFWEQVKHYGKD